MSDSTTARQVLTDVLAELGAELEADIEGITNALDALGGPMPAEEPSGPRDTGDPE